MNLGARKQLIVVVLLLVSLLLISSFAFAKTSSLFISQIDSTENTSFVIGLGESHVFVSEEVFNFKFNAPVKWVRTYVSANASNSSIYTVNYTTPAIYSNEELITKDSYWTITKNLVTDSNFLYENITIYETIPSIDDFAITPLLNYTIISANTVAITIPIINSSFSYSLYGYHEKKDEVVIDINSTNVTNFTITKSLVSPILELNQSLELENTTRSLDEAKLVEPVQVDKSVVWKINSSSSQIEVPDFIENISLRKGNISQNNSVTSIEIVYETPAPVKNESVFSPTSKEVVISSDFHYTNVSAFTYLEAEVSFNLRNKIFVYWKENDTYLDFNPVDTNNNGLIDKVEWVVPHLSTQTFEIIVITKADKLDENRTFIVDIFDSVSQLDGIWSPYIYDGEYVRVTFEENLTNQKDITIYPAIISGNPVVQVFEKDSTVLLETFNPIIDKEYNQILLTALQGSQDTFDLRVVGGVLSFDHIIDPTIDLSFSTATAGDIDGCSLTNETFAIAWCTDTGTFCQLDAYHTNGTILDSVNISTSAPVYSRVALACVNETSFLAARILSEGGASENLEIARYSFLGNSLSLDDGWDQVDADLADNGETYYDVDFSVLDTTHASLTYVDNQDEDVNHRVITISDLSSTGENNVDGNTGTVRFSWHDHVSTAAISEDRAVVCYYDMAPSDFTTALMDTSTNSRLLINDFDNNIGNHGAISCTPLLLNRVAVAYYESNTQDIRIGVLDYSSDTRAVINSGITIDDDAGNSAINLSNVSISTGSIRSDAEYYFAVAYTDKVDETVKAAVYDSDGTEITAPFNVTTSVNTNYNYSKVEVIGSAPALNQFMCNGTFIVAYSESDGITKYSSYHVNGSLWDGVCTSSPLEIDMIYPTFSNGQNNSQLLSKSGVVNASIDVEQTNGSVFLYFDGLNYLATNQSNTYTVLLNVTSPSRFYEYYWFSFGNGTDNLINQTVSEFFIVNTSDDELHYAGFETGYFGWETTSPTVRAQWWNGESSVLNNGSTGGSYSLRISDDTVDSQFNQTFNFTGYDYVSLSFERQFVSLEPGEYVEVFCDGTAMWEKGFGEAQNEWVSEKFLIYPDNCTFDSTVEIRFEGNPGLQNNGDLFYIDGVNLTGEFNKAPNLPIVSINSTNGTNSVSEDLNCFATITDFEGDLLNVTTRWFKDGLLNLTEDFNNSYTNGTFFTAQLGMGNTSVGDDWSCTIQLFDGNVYSENGSSFNLTVLPNAAPNPPTPGINSTDGSDLFDQDLNCFDTIIDTEGDLMNVTVRWYKNDALNLTQDFNNSYVSGTDFVSTLGFSNTTIFDFWRCELQLTDGFSFSLNGSSANLTIVNDPPSITAPYLNSTDETNFTDEDLFCQPQGGTDYENDDIFYAYNWNEGGRALELLNMPFEFRDSAVTAYDYSVSNITGSVFGAVFDNTTGFFGDGAYTFDGDDDRINFSIPIDVTENFSILTRIRPDTEMGNNDGIVGTLLGGTGWFFGTGNPRTSLRFDSGTSSYVTSTGFVERNQWNHIGLTYDGSVYRMYVDGALIYESEEGQSAPEVNSQVYIGGYPDSNVNNYFPGIISEIQFFNRTLNLGQIQSYYEGTPGTLISNATALDDNWSCSVIAYDAYGQSSLLESSNSKIIESAFNLSLQSIVSNDSSFIENTNVTFELNISNFGQRNTSNFSVGLNIYSFNGSYVLNETIFNSSVSVNGNSNATVTLEWLTKPGLWIAEGFVDYFDVVDEVLETNNILSANYSAPSIVTLYGAYNYSFFIGGSSNEIFNWNIPYKNVTLYYYDVDANFVPIDLLPLNGSQDFIEADIALGSTFYNDSLQKLYDVNFDNISDAFESMIISGGLIQNIPVINSTNTSSFKTGMLWDSADGGSEYNGSQDLVFVTAVNESQLGSFGMYDYEIAIPTGLSSLIGQNDLVERLDEVR